MKQKDEGTMVVHSIKETALCQISLLLANALPDPLFRYLSNSNALYLSVKAI
jgi:hypothetical protein